MRLEKRADEKVKDWVQEVTTASDIRLRTWMVAFLLSAYGFLLVATTALFFMEALGKSHLQQASLNWLGGATIGEITGLLTMTYGYFFKRQQ